MPNSMVVFFMKAECRRLVTLHNSKVNRTMRGQLVADAACAPKEVQRFDAVYIQHIIEDIEQPFFCHLRGRPRRDACRRTKPPPPDMPHLQYA